MTALFQIYSIIYTNIVAYMSGTLNKPALTLAALNSLLSLIHRHKKTTYLANVTEKISRQVAAAKQNGARNSNTTWFKASRYLRTLVYADWPANEDV